MEDVFQEIGVFFKEFEDVKKTYKELSESTTLLQEELKVARDEQKAALYKNYRCVVLQKQQQEVILKLLSVKEENVNLKKAISQVEETLTVVKNNNIAEHHKKNEQMRETEQEYLKKIITVQDDASKQVEKVKSDCSTKVEELEILISKLEKKLEEKDAVIHSLKEEVQSLKDWSSANIDSFHKKLAEQERNHRAEMEAWKIAELSRPSYQQIHKMNSTPICETSQNYSYLPSQLLRQEQNSYQPGSKIPDSMSTSSFQKTPLITRQNIPYRQNTNFVRPLTPENQSLQSHQKNIGYVTASDLYMQNQSSVIGNNEESRREQNVDQMNHNGQLYATKRSRILVQNKKKKLFNNK